jgi:AbrB family looped-hinge helix DNA binding protein
VQTKLSTKGQIILPAELRKRQRFNPGERFEIEEKNGKIILSPVKKKRNEGLADWLLKCPPGLKLPPRSKDLDREPPKF